VQYTCVNRNPFELVSFSHADEKSTLTLTNPFWDFTIVIETVMPRWDSFRNIVSRCRGFSIVERVPVISRRESTFKGRLWKGQERWESPPSMTLKVRILSRPCANIKDVTPKSSTALPRFLAINLVWEILFRNF